MLEAVVHKAATMLNKRSKSAQPIAKEALHEIWMAETRENTEAALDLSVKTYIQEPYNACPKIKTRCSVSMILQLSTGREFDQQIQLIRALLKYVIAPSAPKAVYPELSMLHMMFKLGQCAQKSWHRLRGFDHLAKVIEGVKFKDGIEVTKDDQIAA